MRNIGPYYYTATTSDQSFPLQSFLLILPPSSSLSVYDIYCLYVHLLSICIDEEVVPLWMAWYRNGECCESWQAKKFKNQQWNYAQHWWSQLEFEFSFRQMVQVCYNTVYTVACTRENEDRSLFEKTSISSKFLNRVYGISIHCEFNWQYLSLFSKEREHNFFSAGHCSYYSSLLNNVSQFLKMDLHESILFHLKLLSAMKNQTEKRINVHIVHLPFGYFLFLSFPSLPTNPKTSRFCLV